VVEPAKKNRGSAVSGYRCRQGTRVGNWALQKALGKGGQAEVWKAVHAKGEPGPPRALKISLADDEKARQRFTAEVNLLREQSNSRGIMSVVDFSLDWSPLGDVASSHAYYVMPLGIGTLADERWRDDTLMLLRLFREACEGVRHLHELPSPIFHRDLKPSNTIVLEEPFGAVVADMGIATTEEALGTLTATHEVVGSPHYRAPEVRDGKPASVRSDIYGLGRVLERIMTSHEPSDIDPRPVPTKTRSLTPRAARALDDVIRRAVQPRPQDRFASVRELLDALPDLIIDSSSAQNEHEFEASHPIIENPGRHVPFPPGGELGSTVAVHPGDVERRLIWRPGHAGGFAYLTLAPARSVKLNARDRLKAARDLNFTPFGRDRRNGGGWSRFRGQFWHGVYWTDPSERRRDEVGTTSATLLREDGVLVGLTSEVIVEGPQGRVLPAQIAEEAFVEGLREALAYLHGSGALLGISPPLVCSVGVEGLSGTRLAGNPRGYLDLSSPTLEPKVDDAFMVNDFDVDPTVVLRPFFEELWAAYELDRPE
jgi:serine/threonine protein kinase